MEVNLDQRVLDHEGVLLNMVSNWMGHSQMETTAIYANAVGEEQQTIAARMWS